MSARAAFRYACRALTAASSRWGGATGGSLLLLLLAACRHEVTRYYIPSDHNPRFTLVQAEEQIVPFVGVRCAERGASALDRRSGTVRLVLEVGHDGRVSRAELRRGSGDSTLDGVIGAVAAQLALSAPTRARDQRRTLEARFDCAAPGGRALELTLDG